MSNRNGKAKETAKKKSKQKRGWQQLPNEPADVYALLTRFFTQDTGTPAPGRRYSREPRTCERLAAELDAERAAKDAAESAVLSGPPSGTNQPPKSAAPAGGSAREKTATLRRLLRLAKKWSWKPRALDYDAWQSAKNNAAMELWAMQDAAKWAARENDFREKRFTRAEDWLAQADLMCRYPLTKVRMVKERNAQGDEVSVQVIEVAGWRKIDMARIGVMANAEQLAAIRNEGSTKSKVHELDVFTLTKMTSAKARLRGGA